MLAFGDLCVLDAGWTDYNNSILFGGDILRKLRAYVTNWHVFYRILLFITHTVLPPCSHLETCASWTQDGLTTTIPSSSEGIYSGNCVRTLQTGTSFTAYFCSSHTLSYPHARIWRLVRLGRRMD